jgi:hypothetical protein
MLPILEPIAAGILVSLFNRFLIPRLVDCLSPPVDHDDWHSGASSESTSINADVEVHVH